MKPVSDFQHDCEILVLMDPLVDADQGFAGVKQVACFPVD